jgi:hypothetical protein
MDTMPPAQPENQMLDQSKNIGELRSRFTGQGSSQPSSLIEQMIQKLLQRLGIQPPDPNASRF